MRIFISALLLTLLPISNCFALKFQTEINTMGIIIDSKKNMKVGTGFVAGNKRTVITCMHVVPNYTSTEYFFEPEGMNRGPLIRKTVYPLRLLYALPGYDLAVLTSEKDITQAPLQLAEFKRVRPGDEILYRGYDTNSDHLETKGAGISAVGSVLNETTVADFLEFAGEGIPGYSGSPVFNSSGKVVALVREAWLTKGINGGGEILINRAFSTDILSILFKELLIADGKKL